MREAHGRPLRLRNDVAYPGNQPAGALLTFYPQGVRRAQFTCEGEGCRGFRFPAGPEPYGDPERNALLALHNPELRADTAGLAPAEADEVIEGHDRGLRQRAQLALVRQQRPPKRERPTDRATLRRIAGCNAFVLASRGRLGRLEDAWNELEHIAVHEPENWQRITGGRRVVSAGRIQRYWRRVPHATRDEAAKRNLSKDEAIAKAERAWRTIAP